MKLPSLKTLLIEELRDLYSAETQLVKALPKMARAASTEELSDAFNEHLEITKGHVNRLEEIFERLDEKPKGHACQAMEGLLREGTEAIEAEGEDSVRDAALIIAAQKIEHYEISGYGSVRTIAELLGEDHAAELLQETQDEEEEADQKLTQLAEDVVNPEAASSTQDEEEGEAFDEEESAKPKAKKKSK
jgi:ferritin-like metal-binding protein YciE